jgi:two-component system chemotaxis sensor kinase CheA
MNVRLWHQARDFVRRVDDDELQGLHQHTLGGIRAMAWCLAAMGPCGPLFVLVEDVHPSRVLIALPLHLAFYGALAVLARRQFGFRQTSLLLSLLVIGMAIDMTLGAEWLQREPHSPNLLFATVIPMVIGVFVPWRPLLTVLLALPIIVSIYAAHRLLSLPLPSSPVTIVNASLSLALASAIAIQGQRRLWRRLEHGRSRLVVAEREAKARSIDASQRAADVRRILDNVDEGFVRLNPIGEMATERSAVLNDWFGAAGDEQFFVELLRRVDATRAEEFQINWEQLIDGFLPLELVLQQMPGRICTGSKTLALRYRPVLDEAVLIEVIVVISDITAQVAREQTEAELRNLLSALKHVLSDRNGFGQFVREASSLVLEITGGELPNRELLRRLHTLKGNAALFELSSFSALCHELEGRLVAGEERLSPLHEQLLLDAWQPIAALAGLEENLDSVETLEVDDQEHAALVNAVLNGLPRAAVAARLQSWKLEPAQRRLAGLAEKARITASRLEKGALDVVVEDGGVRLPRGDWAPFWSALVHLIRNAIDHGIETPDERLAAGKSPRGKLRLRAALEAEWLLIEVADDGRGIDWQTIRDNARARGLAWETPDELVEALFADGVSSRSYVTQYSGRGVGMCAVREACLSLGGRVEVTSVAGLGTRFVMRFPRPPAAAVTAAA